MSKPPVNLEELRTELRKPRDSPSPTGSECGDYAQRAVHIKGKASTASLIERRLLKDYKMRDYVTETNTVLTGVPANRGFNANLGPPQPDYIEGPTLLSYLPYRIDEEVKGSAVVDGDPYSPTLPHIAGEYTSPAGNMALATMQSAYDGAALVSARWLALSALGRFDEVGRAEIATFTTNGVYIDIDAHFAMPSGDGWLEFHQARIVSLYCRLCSRADQDC